MLMTAGTATTLPVASVFILTLTVGCDNSSDSISSVEQIDKKAGVASLGIAETDDGTRTLYIQKDNPGSDKEANWLPVPNETIYRVMRLYWPKTEAPSILPLAKAPGNRRVSCRRNDSRVQRAGHRIGGSTATLYTAGNHAPTQLTEAPQRPEDGFAGRTASMETTASFHLQFAFDCVKAFVYRCQRANHR